MDGMTPASEAARLLGRKGGLANSPKQQAQRRAPKPGAGRPKGSKNRPKPNPVSPA